MAPTPGGLGYWLVTRSGDDKAFGNATATTGPSSTLRWSGAAGDSASGYWQAASDGGVFALGSAPFFGSMGGHLLNAPVVGIASTPDHGGYWLVASDGGVFAFGDASFFGSMGGHPLNEPVVGIASSPVGEGYWLVASTEVSSRSVRTSLFRVRWAANRSTSRSSAWPVKPTAGTGWSPATAACFAFPGPFWGSLGGLALNAPITGMAATDAGLGYWMVGGDGGRLRLRRCAVPRVRRPDAPSPVYF